jgi:hypothetical protein
MCHGEPAPASLAACERPRRDRIKRWVAAFVLTMASSSALAQAQCDPAKARLELRIYKYFGTESRDAIDGFSLFYGLLAEKLNQIKKQVRTSDKETAYLAKLALEPPFAKIGPQADGETIEAAWRHYNNLLVLSGFFSRLNEQTYQAISKIYWGDWDELKKRGLDDSVSAKMVVDPNEYNKATDTHSLIALYVLALDARARNCPNFVVLHLLDLAQQTASNLERRNELDETLAKIKISIVEQIKELLPN